MNTATLIKQEALRLGFDACGITPAGAVSPENIKFTEDWLNKGYQAGMNYMNRNKELRYDPRLLMENTRSVIVVALNYYPSVHQPENTLSIARYAYGKDYHYIIKQKLNQLLEFINLKTGPVNGRAFTDSAPIMERYWAKQAGLGWQGKNTQLIIPGKGSYFFLGELLIDIPLPYDSPFQENHCGNCSRCQDHCPVNALVRPYSLDSRRCISYHTIENKGAVPQEIQSKTGNRIFGCDKCQEVCPHNRFAVPHSTDDLNAPEELINKTEEEWLALEKTDFNRIFKKSAVERAEFDKLKANIYSALQNKKNSKEE